MRFLFPFLILAIFHSPLQAGTWEAITGCLQRRECPPPTIRLLIRKDVKKVHLEVSGKYSLFDPNSGSRLSRRLCGKSRCLETTGEGLRWGEAFPGYYQLKIQPDTPETTIWVDERQYEGSVYLYDVEGCLNLVNEIPVEIYTESVLNRYRDFGLESEAMAALAIAIRTHAYFQSLYPKNRYWTFDAEKVGYEGIAPLADSVQEAIHQTSYMILSRTGIYEGVATPFPSSFEQGEKGSERGRISLQEANTLARQGCDAAQILAKAFPGSTILLIPSD